MNEQNETTQLRFLEETATRLRQNGFTVEPIKDHHLPICWEKGRLCLIHQPVGAFFYAPAYFFAGGTQNGQSK